jgi:ABC-type multidrug transport system fused ATPase/permease subunit
MTIEKQTREIAALDKRSFFLAESSHFHRSSRYFTNNQDSRTGMLNMLMSRVIPYEAYNDKGVAGYKRLSTQTSLTDRFKALGYATSFVVSQLELEAVVSDLAWDERISLSAAEIEQAKPRHLCFAPDDWENGCEDLAVLPKVVKFVAEHERAFVYQEFNWGHNDVYNDVSGKTNLAYYSGYVDALLSALRERGLSERTLIVLTSDHGFRDRSVQDQPRMVHIPLIFHASGFAAHDDDRLLSHVDFKDLLLSELTGQTNLVTPNELVLIVGPTGSKLLTAISAQGDFTLMRRRGSLRRLSARRSVSAYALTPDELFHLFERYRTLFDDKLSHAR